MAFVVLLVVAFLSSSKAIPSCDIAIVESIPQDLTYMSNAYITKTIWEAWEDLIQKSTKYIKINSLYWTMLQNDPKKPDNSSLIGSRIFSMILKKSRTVPILINHDSNNASCNDVNILRNYKNIAISLVNVTRLVGNGIQHTKMIIGDGTRAFLGSANMDWRSLTQIKEIGGYITNCPAMIHDLEAFWNAINLLTGPNSQIPKKWPTNTWPRYNMTNPLLARVNGVPMALYTATSPAQFNPPHRSKDLAAILNTMEEAKKFIWISVMDYIPLTVSYPNYKFKYWPSIDDAILKAAIDRNVSVKMLISLWNHSMETELIFLRSMASIGRKLKLINKANLQVKIFIIPAFNDFQRQLPYARVSHSKYMVTDSTAYIGTSNWIGNYFNGTVGLSLIAKEMCGSKKCGPKSIRLSMEKIFLTDWNSIYAHDL